MQTPTIERARTRIPAATFARDLLGRDRSLATVGVFLVTAGAAVWVTRSGLQLGGHRAVGLMATHINGRRAAARMADLDRPRRRSGAGTQDTSRRISQASLALGDASATRKREKCSL